MTNLFDDDDTDKLPSEPKTRDEKGRYSKKSPEDFKAWREAVFAGKGASWEMEHGGTPWQHEENVKAARKADQDYQSLYAEEQAAKFLTRVHPSQRKAVTDQMARMLGHDNDE